MIIQGSRGVEMSGFGGCEGLRTNQFLIYFAADNVEAIVRLSEEYQIEQKKEKCERVLLSQPPSLEKLVLAKQLGLSKLEKECLIYASGRSIEDIESYFKDISKETIIEILKQKVKDSESTLSKVREEVNYLRSEHAENCFSKTPPSLGGYYRRGRYISPNREWNTPCFRCIQEVLIEALKKN